MRNTVFSRRIMSFVLSLIFILSSVYSISFQNPVHAESGPRTHTVTFYSDSNTVFTKYLNVSHDSKITAPDPAPQKDGYIFTGWYKNNDCGLGNEWNFNTKVNNDLKLYAKWIEICNVKYISYNNNVWLSVDVNEGSKIAKPNPSPTREGYTFLDWYKESNFEHKWNFSNDTVNKDITLFAKWVKNYTVTFNPNNGNPSFTDTSAYNTKIAAPTPSPTKAGYDFAGWYYKVCGSEFLWNFQQYNVCGDLTLNARWTLKAPYKIEYNLNNGFASGTNPTSYTVLTASFSLINPTRTGYEFAGWTGTDLAAMSTDVTIPAGSTGDRAYTANWTAVLSENIEATPTPTAVPTTKVLGTTKTGEINDTMTMQIGLVLMIAFGAVGTIFVLRRKNSEE